MVNISKNVYFSSDVIVWSQPDGDGWVIVSVTSKVG